MADKMYFGQSVRCATTHRHKTLPAATVTGTRLMRLALLVRHIPDPAHEGRGAFEEVGGGLERASSKSSDESHGRKSMKKKADAMYGF